MASELVGRLRAWRDWHGHTEGIRAMNAAADRIEALEAENARLRETFENARNAADALLGPICASVGRYLYDWKGVDLVKELSLEQVALPAKLFRDLYDATGFEARAAQETDRG